MRGAGARIPIASLHAATWRAAGLAAALLVAAPAALAIEPPPEEQIEPVEPYAGTRYPVDDHDPTAAGHPLRIAAYAVHPVGVALDWILVRPAVWVVRHEPFRTIFGYQD